MVVPIIRYLVWCPLMRLDSFRNRFVGNIEIVRNEQLEKVYFRIPDICSKLWQNTEIKELKDKLTYIVNRYRIFLFNLNFPRENDYERIEDFFDKSQDLMFIMKLNWQLQHHTELDNPNSKKLDTLIKIGNQIGTRYRYFQDISFFLALVLNFLVLIAYTTPPYQKMKKNLLMIKKSNHRNRRNHSKCLSCCSILRITCHGNLCIYSSLEFSSFSSLLFGLLGIISLVVQ